jgi:hypothetical protein
LGFVEIVWDEYKLWPFYKIYAAALTGITARKIYFQNSANYRHMTFKVFAPLSTKSVFKWLVNLPRAK